MAYATSLPRSSQALSRVLDAKGFALDDFEFEEDAGTGMSEMFVGGLLRVRCGSTGEERLYSTGIGSTWLGTFLADLDRGHFASAARARTDRVDPFLLGGTELADRNRQAALRH